MGNGYRIDTNIDKEEIYRYLTPNEDIKTIRMKS